MNMSIDELYLNLEEKKKNLSDLRRKSYDVESEIVGIKEAIRIKTEKSNSFNKKFGKE